MYNRYRKCCCCNDNCNNQVIETACNGIGTTAEYSDMPTCCGCNGGYDNTSSCSCGFDEGMNVFPENPMLAQSYVPIQYMDKTFTPLCGLKMGTIFPELVSPYSPGQSMQEINYLRSRNEIGEGCNG